MSPAVDGQARDINRARWNDLAELHAAGNAYYDIEALAGGKDSLVEEEAAAVRDAAGDVAGLDVLHVQCHIGFDSISLARRGARVTGVDFSPASLAKAAQLAERCGVEVEFVEGDATDLPDSLSGRFDLAYATVGVICWIDDFGAWMRSVFGTLRPGGRLVLLDFHPLAMMVETADPLVLAYSYTDDGGQLYEGPGGSYADRTATLEHTADVQYGHSLGEIVTTAVQAGFRIDALTEHLDASFEVLDVSTPEDDGRWRLRKDGQALPVLFTLRATRPAG